MPNKLCCAINCKIRMCILDSNRVSDMLHVSALAVLVMRMGKEENQKNLSTATFELKVVVWRKGTKDFP